MEKIAVFVDDAEHARRLLAPLLAPAAAPVQWYVIGCAPRLTHRIGKWVSHSQREHWREHWLRELRRQLEPVLAGAQVEWEVARGPLEPLTQRLRARAGTDLRVLDARRPKLGVAPAPLDSSAPAAAPGWAAPAAVTSSLAVVLALTD